MFAMAEFIGYCSAHSKDVACFILLLGVTLCIIINLHRKIWIWDRNCREAQTPSTLSACFKNWWDLLCTRDYYALVLILFSALAISAAIITEPFLRWLVVILSANGLLPRHWEPRVFLASYGTAIIVLCFWGCFIRFWKIILALWPVSRSGEGTRVVFALFGTGLVVACFWISVGLIKGFWRLVMKIGSWFSPSSLPK